MLIDYRFMALVCLLLSFQHVSSLTFGIVPQQRPDRLEREWQPLIEEISRRTHYPIQFATKPTIDRFHHAVLAGEYDFIYVNPQKYVAANAMVGYQAIARETAKTLRGILVVKNDAEIKDVYDLHEKEIAFPSEDAFAASILIRSQLTSLGIEFTPHYLTSHDSVYRNVLHNRHIVGGGVRNSLEIFSHSSLIRQRLRILWETQPVVPHAIATHPRVESTVVADILKALLAIHQSQSGRELLKEVNLNPLEKAQDSDWNTVRYLRFSQ